MKFPSAVGDVPVEWVSVRCGGCNEVACLVASFDVARLPQPVYCTACTEWRQLKCSRCGRACAGTHGPAHGAPVTFCATCAAADMEAGATREAVDSETQPVANVEPEAITEAAAEDAW